MADYSKGKIYCAKYKLDSSLIYVGSTIQTLNKRWNIHKSEMNSTPKGLFHKKVIETNDIGNWYIDLYENYPCKNEKELRKREGEVTQLIGTLNIRIENRSKLEYQRQYRVNHKESQKQYYENNKEKIKEKAKQYYDNNKEKLNEKIKEYYENNKEEIKKKAKQYREKNKQKINEPITCECGCIIKNKHTLNRHKKSNKHINLMNKKSNDIIDNKDGS